MKQELVQAFMLKNGDCFDFVAAQEVQKKLAHLQSSVFKLSKDLIDSIHEEGIVAYTS